MTVPRHDLEAQVRTLGADSLLPPDRKSKRQRAGWQKIESAPKDGTEILGAFQVTGPYASGHWTMTVYSFAAGRWRGDAFQPTHWMPLPLPPTGDM